VQQWDTPSPDDHNLQALHATLLAHQQVIEALVANPSNNFHHHNPQNGSHVTFNWHRTIPCWLCNPSMDPMKLGNSITKLGTFALNVMVAFGTNYTTLTVISSIFIWIMTSSVYFRFIYRHLGTL